MKRVKTELSDKTEDLVLRFSCVFGVLLSQFIN